VSVCVPVLSDPARADRCLDALAGSVGRDQIEVVVMANGLTSGDRGILEQREDVIVVRSDTNLGFAGGNNRAAEIARGRYLLLLNDDSTVDADTVHRLLATAEGDDSIGAVGGRILDEDGRVQEAGSVLWSDGWATHVGAGLPGDTGRFFYVRDTDYCSANGLLVRRSAWDAVGGLDERYHPAYFEDADLCLRLRHRGLRVVHEPRARLTHLEGQSTSRQYRNFLLRRNRQRFVDEWRSELAGRADRPPVPTARQIEDAVLRARGAPPRVLVERRARVEEDADLRSVAEDLATGGWAVTLAPFSSVGPTRSVPPDALVDRGIDVRDDLDDTLASVGTDFEAVVSTGPSASSRSLIRPDGTTSPVVTLAAGERSTVDATTQRVAQVARRLPEVDEAHR
jgi:GT2 family glycosyltransferase